MALEISEKAGVPLLFIDPRGEFVADGKLKGWPTGGPTPDVIEAGIQPIPLDFLPPAGAGRQEAARIAYKLRDSILRCCKSPGDIQRDTLQTAIMNSIDAGGRKLSDVRDAYNALLVQEGKDTDSVLSRLREVTGDLNLFAPTHDAAAFFARPWVISLGRLPGDELKRLAMLLLFDALADYRIGQPDAGLTGSYRTLRHVLVIDEARRILAEKKYESLSDLVRKGRSKGQVMVLLSQDPSDFVGQADDFTSQLGTVVSFACSQSTKGLRDIAGAYGRKLQPQEFSDTHLPTGVALAKLPGRQAERIRAWRPADAQDDKAPA